VIAIVCAIVLISCRFAFAAEIPCRDLGTAKSDELLGTVSRKSIKYGGGVQVGKYDCDNEFQGHEGGCDWETTLKDDRMLDRKSATGAPCLQFPL